MLSEVSESFKYKHLNLNNGKILEIKLCYTAINSKYASEFCYVGNSEFIIQFDLDIKLKNILFQ